MKGSKQGLPSISPNQPLHRQSKHQDKPATHEGPNLDIMMTTVKKNKSHGDAISNDSSLYNHVNSDIDRNRDGAAEHQSDLSVGLESQDNQFTHRNSELLPHLSPLPSSISSAAKVPTTLATKSASPSEDHPFLNYLNGYPALAAPTYQLLSWDTSLCIHINRYSNDANIAAFFKTVSRLGDGWFWGAMVIAALAIELMSGSASSLLWLPLLTVVITSLLGVALYKMLKVKTVRPRPYQVHQVIIMGERPLDVFSFPSGHTLQAVLYTCVLGSYYPALLWVMVPFALLVALSRMVLGLHYPTDVAVGAGLGMGLAQLSPLVHESIEAVLR